MEKSIKYKGSDVHYEIGGTGPALVFIHGYLEAKEIWKGFAERFMDQYTVVVPDIPGHGRSEILQATHDLSLMAIVIEAILTEEKIEEAFLTGHSMGGYIILSYLELFPEKVKGCCLFHSTFFADTEEKVLNREREISLVLCGKKLQIIRTNIPKAFADQNIEPFDLSVQEAREIASRTPNEGIVALLNGMKQRKDHADTLLKLLPDPLIIWGEKDNYIGKEAIDKMISILPEARLLVLQNSGHMGFIEEADKAYAGLKSYLDSCKIKKPA